MEGDIQERMSRLLRPQEIHIKIKSILNKISLVFSFREKKSILNKKSLVFSFREKKKHPIKYMKNSRKKEGYKGNLSSNMKVL